MTQARVYGSRGVDSVLSTGESFSIYVLFAVYLCHPYWLSWSAEQRLLPIAMCLGGGGAYLLSRRWVRSVTASLFCGMLYGFGPLTLYLTRFHFSASFIVAAVPWLFCPWAYIRRWLPNPRRSLQFQWLSALLLGVPFLLIIGLFKLLTKWHWFILPIHLGPLNTSQWTGFLVPLIMAQHNDIIWGLYHVSLGPLFIGLVMILKARRWSVLSALLLSFVVAAWHPVMEVSSLIWLTVSVLFMSVCAGIGFQGLLYAGVWDRAWVLTSALWLVALGVFMLLQSGKYFQSWFGLPYAQSFVTTGKFYIVGAVGLLGVYGLLRAGKQMRWLRLCFIALTLLIDIVFSASMVIDQIF